MRRTCRSTDRSRRSPGRWHLACAACLAFAAHAQDPVLEQAEAMVRDGQFQQTHDLLAPLASTHAQDADFFYLLGRATLGTGNAEQARVALEHSIEIDPDDTEAHLALGRVFRALGEYAKARNQFEVALHLENLPSDLLSQVEIYDEAAREVLEEGRSTTAFGYAVAGYGRYRVNSTRGTHVLGGGDNDELFWNLRTGGGINHAFGNGYAIDATLDYRQRFYDEESRDDRDLRWSFAGSRGVDDGNVALGLRGRVSYRGNSDYRNDIAGFVDYSRNLNLENQLTMGLSVERRRYPSGPLRARSRTNASASLGWSTSFADGAASFSFTAHGGRNYATSRPDGESNVYGATAKLDYTFGDTLDAFVFAWWERDAYNTDRVHFHPDEVDEEAILRRKDNLYEGGLGVVWEFLPTWSLRPELLYIRDQSNVVGFNYSSTEVWINVRKNF